MVSIKGIPAVGVYAATKAALRSFARTWAVDLKGRNIRLNVVAPGTIVTPGYKSELGLSDEQIRLQGRSRGRHAARAHWPAGRINHQPLGAEALAKATPSVRRSHRAKEDQLISQKLAKRAKGFNKSRPRPPFAYFVPFCLKYLGFSQLLYPIGGSLWRSAKNVKSICVLTLSPLSATISTPPLSS
jgi:Enoyl-(Acyl carrier protein) reductase